MRRLFGTNGIRGVVGEEMTAALALDVGRAVGTHLQGAPVALGRDTRTSGPMLHAAVLAGLTAAGCSVRDLGVAPSPAIQYYVKTRDVAGGVIVTASHNPREYNGLKVVDAEGMEAAREVEERIEALYFEGGQRDASWEGAGTVDEVRECNSHYLEALLQRVDVATIRKARLHVVLDCANGASYVTSPHLLRRLGCRVTTLNAQPDGTFPGHPPEPRAEHLGTLREMVEDAAGDLGVVHDGDADRVIFVDEGGRFVPGDRSLALVAGYVVRREGGGTVVTPVSSSRCVEDAVRAAGGEVRYTAVGAPLVARTMRDEGAVFGGEENGGLIFPRHQHCRDGAMGMATVLEIVATEERGLSDLLAPLPTYHLKKSGVACPQEHKEAVLAALLPRFEGRRVETVDGLKVWEGDGWVLIRPSGTEALFRVFAEGTSPEAARRLHDEAVAAVQEAVEAATSR